MKEQEIYNHQLAIRYFEGRITPSEEEILFRFVNDAPSKECSANGRRSGCFPIN